MSRESLGFGVERKIDKRQDIIIDVLDLKNETLTKLNKIHVYDTDKIIINYKNFSEIEINNKILSLSNTFYKLAKILYDDNYFNNIFEEIFESEISRKEILSSIFETEDDKYWIRLEYDIDNTSMGIENTKDDIINIIKLLTSFYEYADDIDIEEAFYDLIRDKIDSIYIFRKRTGISKRYLNYDLAIEINEIK